MYEPKFPEISGNLDSVYSTRATCSVCPISLDNITLYLKEMDDSDDSDIEDIIDIVKIIDFSFSARIYEQNFPKLSRISPNFARGWAELSRIFWTTKTTR